MNTTTLLRRLSFSFVLMCATVLAHAAQNPPAQSSAAAASVLSTAGPGAAASSTAASGVAGAEPDAPADSAGDQDDFPESTAQRPKSHAHRHGNDIVSVGHDSHLRAGEKADSVVSVFGSSTSEGEAVTVVSVLGNTRVTGPVHDGVVAVLGNVYIDSKVEGDAVAVLGSVELGPHAVVEGDVTSVLGSVHRAADSIVSGDVHDVFVGEVGDVDWLHTWIHRCLLEARPLAFVSGIEWAWSIAFVFLALYLFLALLFPAAIGQCIATLETQPGHSALAALLAILLTPVLLVLLCITVIGIAAVPFVVMTLLCLSLFGKAVVLAWMGHRVVGHRSGSVLQPAVAVLIGGGIALLFYVIPVIGLLVYKLLGFFGVGAVVYTLLLGQRARQAARAGTAKAAVPPAAPSPAAAQATGGAYVPPAGDATGAPSSTEPPTPILAALPRAGFWVRMGALLIDVMLIGVLTQSGGYIFGSHHHPSDLHLLVLAVYGACMWKLRGSTVGGLVCDLRVVRVDGRTMEWETAIVRALGCFLSLAVCGLGFIWIAFDENHQAWHDKIAGTVVVRVPKPSPLS